MSRVIRIVITDAPERNEVTLKVQDAEEDSRAERAMNEKMKVKVLGAGIYEVHSKKSGNYYRVDLDKGTCTCPDYQHRQSNCKHKRRVAMNVNMGELPAPKDMGTPTIATLEREVSNRLAVLDKLNE